MKRLILSGIILIGCSKFDIDKKMKQADFYYNQNKNSEALQIYKEITKNEEDSVKANFMAGKIEYQASRFEEAEKHFEKVKQINKCGYKANYWLAKSRVNIPGKEKEAFASIQYITDEFPDSAESEYLKGNLFERNKQFEEAIQSYQSVLKSENILALSCLRLAHIYKRTGLKDKSSYYLNRGLKLSENNKKLKNLIQSEILKLEEKNEN